MSRRELPPDHMPDADRSPHTGWVKPPEPSIPGLQTQLAEMAQKLATVEAENEHLKISLGRCRDELTARNLDPRYQVHTYSHGVKGSA